jgi:hypothetical protein
VRRFFSFKGFLFFLPAWLGCSPKLRRSAKSANYLTKSNFYIFNFYQSKLLCSPSIGRVFILNSRQYEIVGRDLNSPPRGGTPKCSNH